MRNHNDEIVLGYAAYYPNYNVKMTFIARNMSEVLRGMRNPKLTEHVMNGEPRRPTFTPQLKSSLNNKHYIINHEIV